MKQLLLFFSLIAASSGTAQTFQDFVNRVNTAPEAERTAIVDSFMAAVPSFPLVEQNVNVVFLYRGSVGSVTVPGDANGWAPSAFPMTRLPTTNLWYHTRTFESDARLDYKFVLDGSNWILDPRNPFTVSGGFGPNSELRMPAYIPAPEIQYYPAIPHGTVRDTVFFSTNLANSRTIRIYTPPNYETSTDSFGVILFHDGLEYVTLAQANNVIDYLISQNRIKPVIAVFVPPVNRTAEYRTTQQNQFTSFIVSEIMPYIDARYRTRKNPANRATLGASDGGNIALWLAFTHSEVFGNVAAQSSNIQSSISSGFQNSPRLNLKFYMDLGTYDIAQLIPLVRNFIPILQSKGYPYQYIEYNEGHSWGNWRAHVDNALELFFPAAPTTVAEPERKPLHLELLQNYPNPFNPTTTIRFSVGRYGDTSLRIFDVLGIEVVTLVNEVKAPGEYEVQFDASSLSSGVYYYQLRAAGFVETKKMILLR